jgi:transcription-repair coupling factor (superfamily II helicase)
MPVDIPTLQAAHDILKQIEGGAKYVDCTGVWGAGKSLIAFQTAQSLGRSLLFVTPGRLDAEAVFEDFLTFAGEDRCAYLPPWEVLPTDAMAPADDIVAERMNTMRRMMAASAASEPIYVVAPLRAIQQRVVKPGSIASQTVTFTVNEDCDRESVVQQMVDLGYQREVMVEQRGHISVRGGILDVFPASEELPFRIEFFGDIIESIRRFEPETQRSVDRVDHVTVLPRSEKATLEDADGLTSITSYLDEESIVALSEPSSISEEAKMLADTVGQSKYFASFDTASEEMRAFSSIRLAQLPFKSGEKTPRVTARMNTIPSWQGQPESFWDQLKQWDVEGFAARLLCATSGERRRLLELVHEQGYRPGRDAFDLKVEVGRLSAGFTSKNDKIAILSEQEMFGRKHIRRRRRRFTAGTALTTFSDLNIGDYVVHAQHGIGRYGGIRRFDGRPGDFMLLQYAAGDTVYVAVTHIDLIEKYSAGDGATPKMDRIGGKTWARTKSKVKKAVKDMTDVLLKLYAERSGGNGHAFPNDTPWQNEFEDAFEYDETPDQARAIEDVKRDMQSKNPMDRLICGDVGYGKTEVALRGAFKAVQDGMQAAVLAPTTVLVEQHYHTFSERFADYPITVGMVSRFRTAKQNKETIERLKSGEVDVVVGTHRILSKDVEFSKIGLIIIDEEQRFGVAQKEKLKHLRTQVDVIAMSATPIPRTLNMAFMGVRDMSVISTAPNDRLPVHTCVEVFDEALIQEALQRELAREGQVFFVHNRVQTILPFVKMVRELLPSARVAMGHGQMPERELESVMGQFVRRDIDVLVCTTIIGSGIDIPNANTIIINDAQNFGLSELYQLRGRVGRYKHRAFAYLLIPGEKALSEDAQKRLKALEEFSTLGSGFRIAMRDLEIRGAGNLLGGEQSGNINAVGFDTYQQLLREAVTEIKGDMPRERKLPAFEANVDAYIPDDYITTESQRITLYKRIAAVTEIDAAEEMDAEIADRFGDPPAPVKRLLQVMHVRVLGASLGVTNIAAGKTNATIEFESGAPLSRAAGKRLASEFGDALRINWSDAPNVSIPLNNPGDVLDVSHAVLRVVEDDERD